MWFVLALVSAVYEGLYWPNKGSTSTGFKKVGGSLCILYGSGISWQTCTSGTVLLPTLRFIRGEHSRKKNLSFENTLLHKPLIGLQTILLKQTKNVLTIVRLCDEDMSYFHSNAR